MTLFHNDRRSLHEIPPFMAHSFCVVLTMACCGYCLGLAFPLDIDCAHTDTERALVMKLGQYMVDGWCVKLPHVADDR
jgi:hypothetical protein